MNFRFFLKKTLMEFFMITTCVNVAIFVLGSSIHPDALFGYDALLSPIIFGLIASLPSFIFYSRKELSFHKTIAGFKIQRATFLKSPRSA